MTTKIEWTHRPNTIGESWNLVGGCTEAGPGCDNCYARGTSWRIQNNPKHPIRYEGVTTRGSDTWGPIQWTGRINLDEKELSRPLWWQKPRTVFVCSMADLFHRKVPDSFILRAFQVMAQCDEHTFLILTKRAYRMRMFFSNNLNVNGELCGPNWRVGWPLPHVWLGVTAENQECANKRIPWLLSTPAAVRWVSVEPMISAIDLNNLEGSRLPGMDGYTINALDSRENPCLGKPYEHINWVVIGAESGPNRREMKESWALDLLRQCDDAAVSAFVKQVHLDDGTVSKDPAEWWPGLRRREWPG